MENLQKPWTIKTSRFLHENSWIGDGVMCWIEKKERNLMFESKSDLLKLPLDYFSSISICGDGEGNYIAEELFELLKYCSGDSGLAPPNQSIRNKSLIMSLKIWKWWPFGQPVCTNNRIKPGKYGTKLCIQRTKISCRIRPLRSSKCLPFISACLANSAFWANSASLVWLSTNFSCKCQWQMLWFDLKLQSP